jgi:superfamily I DNA/RNA helicase
MTCRESPVARLAIAKDFLAEYSKLEKAVQRAVTAAIGKFSDQTYAGTHLEKIRDSVDERIRTIRVDGYWRGVVLAPESGDIYCLVTVLPHDKAIAYARSHRFSVNQALGVLEVRDEEGLRGLEPSLQAAAESQDHRLFGHVSDSDLTRLGVDASILPVVRLLTSEAHLDALQAMLPEVQYAALFALAFGMTIEEAWQEVAQYLPTEAPAEKVNTSDLVSAMERTPSRVAFMAGQEELERMLANPFAAWRIFLHPAQRKIAYVASYAGPAQVTGGAGTGKTVTALHRAAYLAGRYAVELPLWGDGPPILLTTFTRSLAAALDAQLAELVGDEEVRSRIEVLNVDRLAYRVVQAARGAPSVAGSGELRQMWADAAAASGLPFTAAFLQHEWEQVILAQGLRTEQAYLTCQRRGRGTPLSKPQRSQVWQATQHVERELTGRRWSTQLQLADEAAELLNGSGPCYRHIVVDEAQDLHPARWRLLRAAVSRGPDDLFIAADPNQRIYENNVSLAALGISVRGRSRRLRLNYRTTQEILSWAIPLLGLEPVTGLDDEADTLIGYRSPVHGRQPEVQVAATREEEFAALAERVRAWLDMGIEPHAIGVAARARYLADQARDALNAAGIGTVSLKSTSTASAVRAGTMHNMKGLEFQAVAVIGVEKRSVPSAAAVIPEDEDPLAYKQGLQRERCALFVACTRARDHLFVSYVRVPSPFLSPEQLTGLCSYSR